MTGRMPLEIAEALWEGVTRGLVTSDGFQAVRGLLAGRYRSVALASGTSRRAIPSLSRARWASTPRRPVPSVLAGGRWSLLAAPVASEYEPDELADAIARQLLERWGVVVRELYARESAALPWRTVLFALRRLEARGVARGGRFVAGPIGEQFALTEALEALRSVAKSAPDDNRVTISAADPLNLTGIVLPGARVPAVRGRTITFSNGLVVDDEDTSLELAETS